MVQSMDIAMKDGEAWRVLSVRGGVEVRIQWR